jgi:Bacterial conjugation TrbI-like protein
MENNEENLAPDDQQYEMLSAEELEALTQAPQGQPIMPESEFSVEEARSPRPQWKRPLPKLALVALVLCPVFAFIWMFFNGFRRHRLAKPPKPETTATVPARSKGEIERLQEENARLKVGRALDDQSKIEEQLQKGRDKPQHPQPAATPRPATAPRSAPSTPRVATSPQPITPAPRIQTAPPTVSRPASVARSTPSISPSRPVDPMERWQQLAQLGSYGSVSPEETTTPEFSRSEPVSPRVAQAMQNTPYKVASIGIPTAQIAPTSAVQSIQPEFSPIPQPVERLTESELPEILVEEEARILNAEVEPSREPEQRAIAAGTHSPGELTTPIVVDESGQSDRFTVRLDEPILDNRGDVAFPEETEFVVQVDRVSQAGQVHVSAIAANWSVDEQQQEIILPPDTIQVRGEDGEPLMAEHFQDRGGAIAGMDAGQFLLGAAGRAAQLYTRSDSRVQTRGSSTVISESNPAPNIVAGIVEGGTDAVLESIQERNQRAIERMEQPPNVRYIESGTDVEIFVNQSMFMPQ